MTRELVSDFLSGGDPTLKPSWWGINESVTSSILLTALFSIRLWHHKSRDIWFSPPTIFRVRKYVSISIVRTLVGDKVYKVDTLLLFLHIPLAQDNTVHILPSDISFTSCCVPGSTSSLFVETSAKIAVGVRQTLANIMKQIYPELWIPVSNIIFDISQSSIIHSNFDSSSNAGVNARGRGC